MVIKFMKNSKVTQTVGRVSGFLFSSCGSLLITFEDYSELRVKREDYESFFVEEK